MNFLPEEKIYQETGDEWLKSSPAGIYLFKVNIGNTRK